MRYNGTMYYIIHGSKNPYNYCSKKLAYFGQSLKQMSTCQLQGVVSRALQDIISKFVYCKNHTSYENFKLKLSTCMCTQSMALGTRTKFQLEILNINLVSGNVYFCKIILESSQNVSEPNLRSLSQTGIINLQLTGQNVS